MSEAVATTRDMRAWIASRLDPLDETRPANGVVYALNDDIGLPPVPVEGPLTHAAVLIGLVERDDGFNVILTRRADTLRSHTGQTALPGGRCDEGESASQAAIREAWEEIGLEPRFVKPVGISTPAQTATGYLIVPVVAFIEPGFTLTPNPDEVADIFETPLAFLMDPMNHQEHEKDFDNGMGVRRFWGMTHENRFIWGVTARILMALYNRLYGGRLA